MGQGPCAEALFPPLSLLPHPNQDTQQRSPVPFENQAPIHSHCPPYPSPRVDWSAAALIPPLPFPLSPLPSHTVLESPLYNIWQIIMGGGFPTESPVSPQSWTPKASSLVVFILVNICHHRKRRGGTASATKTRTLDKIARATFSSPGPGHLAKHLPQGTGVGSPGDRISSELHHRTASDDI